jgi:ATP-dependent helicase/nuclease subunit A
LKNFIIYKSSAGSGKTYTLVKEYLRLALSSSGEYRHILAVTFTNKAAEEMKTRIINSLIALSHGKDKGLEKQLMDEGVKGNLALKASEVLQNILHKYSYFSVSTIDSFFHKILRSFAKELALPLGYNIELDTSIVMDKITEELLDEIGSNPELTKYIEDYVFYNIDENRGWKIDVKIKELASEIFKERYWIKKGDRDELADNREKMQGFIGTLFVIINNFEGKMLAYSDEAATMLDEYSLLVEDFPYGKGGFMGYLINNIRKQKYEPTGRAAEASGNLNKWTTKNSKPAVLDSARNGLYNILQDTVEFHNTQIRKYNTAKELIKTVYVLGIYKDLMDKLKDYRDENKMMLISDTNNILMKVISGDNSPFVYEKIGGIYKNYLIDEFQDTSTFQWKNFLPLIENSLAENNFSMIVGDVKQSIYRWRNGNMKLLLEGVKSDLTGFNDLIEEKYLNENYRSKEEIIKFNNRFFTAASLRLGGKNPDEDKLIINSYADSSQSHNKSKGGGYVNISFISPVYDEESTARENAIKKTIDAVKDALSGAYMQKDIMVLTRNKVDGGEAAHYLTDAGFKVVSNDSLLLTNSPKVKLLVNILMYIVDNKNHIARTEILYNYLVYVKGEESDLNSVFNDYKNTGDSLFTGSLPDEFFAENNRSRLNPAFFRLSIFELTETLIRIFKLNNSVDAYLLRFMEVVAEFSSSNSSDLTGFIEWWNGHKEEYSIIIPGQEDAIRIMTIHKAKGLESPVVIIPFANWDMDISGSRDLIWVSSDYPPFNESSAFFVKATKTLKQSYFEKDYTEEAVLTNLDNLNLLYVAFTRAVERLHVFVPEKGGNAYNAGKLIEETLKSSVELSQYFKSENEFEIGKKLANNSEEKYTENSYKPSGFISTEYQSKTVIKPASKGFAIEKEKKYLELKNRGIILHKALSLIKYPADAEQAVEQLKIEGLIVSDNEDELINELVEIFKIDEVRKWFTGDYEIKTETEVILPDGKIYKPDRVLLKDKKAIVIDYKTGKHKKENIEQVKHYADILSMMGYIEIERYLFYVPERKIVKV